jgi:hypothetical protein
MVAFFLGGIALSAVTGLIYVADGRGAVCLLGAASAAIGPLHGWRAPVSPSGRSRRSCWAATARH